jgi:lipid II:glycine glycyltransferase (peptidoglycan interpeptide bridge formation enzyme)
MVDRGAAASDPDPDSGSLMPLRVRTITYDQHLDFVRERPISFLQSPSWPGAMPGWVGHRVGWFTGAGDLVGVALVMLRVTPVVPRYFAYLPEGPVLDWRSLALQDWLTPLVDHLRDQGAYAIRLSPADPLRRWESRTVKDAVGSGVRLADVPPDQVDLRAEELTRELAAAGWTRGRRGPTWSRFSFYVPLSGRSSDEIFAGCNQSWRQAIRRADKAGVKVVQGGYDELPEFHRIYLDTAARAGFEPRPLEHFQRIFRSLSADGADRIRLYLGVHDGEVVSGNVVFVAGSRGASVYGASASHKRKVYPSHAGDWQVIQDLVAEGISTYDLRGISSSLDPDDPMFGMLQFKLGTGGVTVEQIGDWDLALSPFWHRLSAGYLFAQEVAVPRARRWVRASVAKVRTPHRPGTSGGA